MCCCQRLFKNTSDSCNQGVGGMSRKAKIHRPFRAGVLDARPTFCDLLRNLEAYAC